MNSIAIWSDNDKELKLHLDLNLWVTKGRDNNYIEFGIKLLEPPNIASLYLYLPFKFNAIEDKVKDLKPELLNAMFNESLSVKNLNNSSFTEVIKDNELLFYLYKLSKQDYTIEDVENEDGKILKITVNKNSANSLYYRFRIKTLDNIFEEITVNWFFTNGVKEQINFIEVSLNSVRKLPSYVVNKIGDVKIESINLFIMTESFISLIFKSKEIHKSRVLESIWKDYVESKEISKIVAYHWKKPESFKDYNLFVKTSYINKSKRLIVAMIIVTLLVGSVGGIVGNLGTEFLKYKKESYDANSTKTSK